MPKTPAQKGAVTRAKNAKTKADTAAYEGKVAEGNAAREGFTAANPQRFTTAQDHTAAAIGNNPQLRETVRRAGFDPDVEIPRLQGAAQRGSTRHTYMANGWDQEHGEESSAHPLQGTLFDHPGTVKNPTPWEHMTPEAQAHTTKRLATFGITPESVVKAQGARLDKGNAEEDGQHGSFYSTMGLSSTGAKMPKQVLVDAAKDNGVQLHTQAAANAITSPNNRAVSKSAAGDVVYPNNEAATHAVKWAQGGGTGDSYLHHPDYYVPPEDKVMSTAKTGKMKGRMVKAPDETRGYPVQGYPANAAKAIDAVHGIEHKGQSVAESWTGSNSPKTGPFHNAWVAPDAPEGNFTVTDTHELESMAPHATHLEQQILAVPGAHAFNDYHKRQAMAERGMSTVHRAQSLTWRSTKVDEGHAGDVAELTMQQKAPEQHVENPDQMDMFADHNPKTEGHAIAAQHVAAAHAAQGR